MSIVSKMPLGVVPTEKNRACINVAYESGASAMLANNDVEWIAASEASSCIESHVRADRCQAKPRTGEQPAIEDSVADQLFKLAALLESGALAQADFDSRKRQLLAADA